MFLNRTKRKIDISNYNTMTNKTIIATIDIYINI